MLLVWEYQWDDQVDVAHFIELLQPIGGSLKGKRTNDIQCAKYEEQPNYVDHQAQCMLAHIRNVPG